MSTTWPVALLLLAACGGASKTSSNPTGRVEELESSSEPVPATGPVRLTVQIAGKEGADIVSAQLFLLPEDVMPATVADIAKQFSTLRGKMKTASSVDGKTAVFSQVAPGRYNLCIIPLGGKASSEGTSEYLAQHAGELRLSCQRAEIVHEDPTIEILLDPDPGPTTETDDRQQRTKTEDRRPKTEDREPMTDDR